MGRPWQAVLGMWETKMGFMVFSLFGYYVGKTAWGLMHTHIGFDWLLRSRVRWIAGVGGWLICQLLGARLGASADGDSLHLG